MARTAGAEKKKQEEKARQNGRNASQTTNTDGTRYALLEYLFHLFAARKQSPYFKTPSSSQVFLQKAKKDVQNRMPEALFPPSKLIGPSFTTCPSTSAASATPQPAVAVFSVPAPTRRASTQETARSEMVVRLWEDMKKNGIPPRRKGYQNPFERTPERVAQIAALKERVHNAHFSPPVRKMLKSMKTMYEEYMRDKMPPPGDKDALKNPSGEQLHDFTLHLLEAKTEDARAKYTCEDVQRMMGMVARECMSYSITRSLVWITNVDDTIHQYKQAHPGQSRLPCGTRSFSFEQYLKLMQAVDECVLGSGGQKWIGVDVLQALATKILALILHNNLRASELFNTKQAEYLSMRCTRTIKLKYIAFEIKPIPSDRIPPRQLKDRQNDFGMYIGGSIAVPEPEYTTYGPSKTPGRSRLDMPFDQSHQNSLGAALFVWMFVRGAFHLNSWSEIIESGNFALAPGAEEWNLICPTANGQLEDEDLESSDFYKNALDVFNYRANISDTDLCFSAIRRDAVQDTAQFFGKQHAQHLRGAGFGTAMSNFCKTTPDHDIIAHARKRRHDFEEQRRISTLEKLRNTPPAWTQHGFGRLITREEQEMEKPLPPFVDLTSYLR
ncbi:hypothetical protein HK097_004167 [Rhizophlyctis rosea]|uniref:Uncharacterized protein n=1 Tax=Rhizophlyctis rosea TaxID=64517 RepID=A0AAD5SF19_9FUNG|nr:hypothetical protein HK097_004167 [Rhizophlyctis rosea]